MKENHVSEFNADNFGEEEPSLLRTSLKFPKLCVGVAVINPAIS